VAKGLGPENDMGEKQDVYSQVLVDKVTTTVGGNGESLFNRG